ncbi:acyl-CoA thioesterase [Marinibactrum halimedae]|uniref:4-hydroxybenzoyl-CoA thioesterase n=1 Tax=Marinibactrum halimedae TaxID=1444977 RepID=A0AA37TBZ9_9GAMM|nr:acyl-CoA thioesterase [Marinibactrum halimedae]MCD9460438.1 acyl-CoA thioesterase [Marinibactrum halimedae]GLS27431.1 4-hydroxybenzoyl-CoA thioesterase [Marinibactrum halimedae]
MKSNKMGVVTISTEVVVEFHDVDSLRVVWHGHYAKYLEIARCRLLEALGYDYRVMEKTGHMWPIVEMRTKFIRPAVFMQRLIVEASLVEWENRLRVNYRIMDAESGEVLSKAQTTQMVVDIESGETLFESPQTLINMVNHYIHDHE